MDNDSAAHICRAVWTVMQEQGVAAVSVRSVAKAAGVSAGRVQHHFPSRGALLHASLREMIAAARARHDVPRPPAEALLNLLTQSIPSSEGSRRGVSVFYSYVALGVSDGTIASILSEAKVHQLSEIVRLLGEIAPSLAESEAHARGLQATSDGATLAALLGTYSAADAATVVRDAIDQVT